MSGGIGVVVKYLPTSLFFFLLWTTTGELTTRLPYTLCTSSNITHMWKHGGGGGGGGDGMAWQGLYM